MGRHWNFLVLASLLAGAFIPVLKTQTVDAVEDKDPAHSHGQKSPAELRKVPLTIRRELQSADCMISRNGFLPEPQNVVHGSFARHGQTDWAALCEHGGMIELLIFWGGPAHCAGPVEEPMDEKTMLSFTNAYIQTASPAKIVSFAGADFPPPDYPPLSQDGLEAGGEQASLVHYCYQGKWITLMGAD